MFTKTIQCPRCGEQRVVNLTDEELEKLKRNELVIGCTNCGHFLKVDTGEKPPSGQSRVYSAAYSQKETTTENPRTKRLKFLVSEREQKCAEMEQIAKRKRSTGSSSILHAILGDGIETHLLEMQQMNARLSDIQGEIRKIDFEIEQLQSEIANKGTQNTQTVVEEKMFCRYCGVPNETDAVFCKKCGKKIS